MIRDAATQAQVDAANPLQSTWLSANAGSGKTRVLTDRVARLLLEDVSPQNILCLTYTKAAATEMQNRLFRRLGEWAMMADGDLRRALAELGVERSIDAAKLRQARTLFARAIEGARKRRGRRSAEPSKGGRVGREIRSGGTREHAA